jgi:hypothetical protein
MYQKKRAIKTLFSLYFPANLYLQFINICIIVDDLPTGQRTTYDVLSKIAGASKTNIPYALPMVFNAIPIFCYAQVSKSSYTLRFLFFRTMTTMITTAAKVSTAPTVTIIHTYAGIIVPPN